jgi:predicted nuclease with TOPRIM domain
MSEIEDENKPFDERRIVWDRMDVRKLLFEINALREENERLREDYQKVKALLGVAAEENQRLTAECKEDDEENRRLRHRCRNLERELGAS